MREMEEIELTYLARELPLGLDKAPKNEILDIYIPSTIEHPTLRIRANGKKYEMTKKEPISGSDPSHQLETTIPLTKEEYDEFAQLKGKRSRKTRYYFEENGVRYEIAVFHEGLEGLVLVDIEFGSLEEKDGFQPPQWCLADVTQEKFLAGGMLCGKSYFDIEAQLKKFGYEKLTI